MEFKFTYGINNYVFKDLKTLMAKASPLRSGDVLAGISANSYKERVAAQMALADVPLKHFLEEAIIPYEEDEITRLIIDNHDLSAFSHISHLTVGALRDFLLDDKTDNYLLKTICKGITPEMAAAVSKIMRNQDLISVARKCRVITAFRTTIGLEGRFSTRLQPNHPSDDPKGITASIIDGLLYGIGDAVIGINPALDSPNATKQLLDLIENLRIKFEIPIQSCVLSHITTTLEIIEKGAPVDLAFQSIGGTELTNKSFGINFSILKEAYEATKSLKRGTVGQNVMYFETGQGSALSANANYNADQQTLESRAYAIAREFEPLLVNTVVGFIGPEYLFNGKQIIRAALEDHFCGKLLGLPMGVDICYTNHADADQDDMDNLLTLLGVAGCNFIMGVPGADDIMLHYQSTSFHDALYIRNLLGLKPAPEFEDWLKKMEIFNHKGHLIHSSSHFPTRFLRTFED